MMFFRALAASCLAVLFAASPVQAQEVSQAEIGGFLQQVKSCWALTPDDAASGLSVKIRMELDPAGAILRTEIIDANKSAAGRHIATGAIRALERCAPYSFSAETYEQWKTLEIELQP
ncbi:hypothetical protein [Devosia sp.]|uniref:hypothetical protein n=1 Tax=Devosia sp. TaxID=1871048 RepID=UPI001B058110|nr:hypothetical protein [Devosia sp.]MBO9589859.1 hypothetical protein [Devosia sp.]